VATSTDKVSPVSFKRHKYCLVSFPLVEDNSGLKALLVRDMKEVGQVTSVRSILCQRLRAHSD
jgi:hypothetical protein